MQYNISITDLRVFINTESLNERSPTYEANCSCYLWLKLIKTHFK